MDYGAGFYKLQTIQNKAIRHMMGVGKYLLLLLLLLLLHSAVTW